MNVFSEQVMFNCRDVTVPYMKKDGIMVTVESAI